MKISCICMDENVRDSLAHFDRRYTEIYAVGCTGKLTTVIIHRPRSISIVAWIHADRDRLALVVSLSMVRIMSIQV